MFFGEPVLIGRLLALACLSVERIARSGNPVRNEYDL
jgi:hypothetical protein